MNFIEKISGSTGDDQKEERPSTEGPLVSSVGGQLISSSYHHHLHHHQPFVSPPSNIQHHTGWMLDGGELSSNQKDEGSWNMVVEREHMFDKVVTPSDVGKLNRLVIPKQHAERFFPLDSSTNYKGLLLNFEDMSGKLWRFQYSYWNSSQSYVMTKGWSRFVKEKKLDAGDIVSFQRGVGATAKDRLFIDWRRRVNPPRQLPSSSDISFLFHNRNLINPWNPMVLQSFPARRNPSFMLPDPNRNPNCSTSRSVYFRPAQQQFKMMQRSELGLGFGCDPPTTAASNPPVHGKASGKRLRLFGVNMDCELTEDEDDHIDTFAGSGITSSLIPSSSSSVSRIPYLQLSSDYGESECNESRMLPASDAAHDFDIIENSTVNSEMSLDLKISHMEGES